MEIWQIVLKVLIILGIVLLSILAVVLFLLLIVLFYPITYEIKSNGENTVNADVKARWLFNLIKADASFSKENGLFYKVKALWITIIESKDEEPEKSKDEKAYEKFDTFDEGKESGEAPEEKEEGEKKETSSFDPKTDFDPSKDDDFIWQDKADDSKVSDKKVKSDEKKLEKIKGKLAIVKNKYTYVTWYFKQAKHQYMLYNAKRALIKLLRHISPRRYKGYVVFGTGEPDITGEIFAMISVFYLFYGDKIDIQPDFSTKVFNHDIKLNGHILSFVVIIVLIKLFKQRDLLKFIDGVKAA